MSIKFYKVKKLPLMPYLAITASSKMLPVIKFTEELPNIPKA
jgi:hypothetical protein